jgi:gliding motility-associated-like protein
MHFSTSTLLNRRFMLHRIVMSCLLGISVLANAQQEEHDPRGGGGLAGTDFMPPKNGDGVLGHLYNQTKCGLNYVEVSRVLGQRFFPVGNPQPTTLPISFSPCGSNSTLGTNVEKAYVWCTTSGNGASFSITVTNPEGATQTFPATLIGSGPDKCWNYTGAYTYRAEITSIISQSGNYIFSGFPTSGNSMGNDVDGMTAIIIYTDPDVTYQGTVVIDDGNITKLGDVADHTISMAPVCGPATMSKAFCAIGDLQMDVGITMNGTPTGMLPGWWNYLEENTTVTVGQTAVNFHVLGDGDCYTIAMAGIYYRTNCATCVPTSSIPIILQTTSTLDTCGLCEATITVTPSGPAGPFTYTWTSSAAGSGSTATNLCAGTYMVTVGTTGSCITNTATVTIAPAQAPVITDLDNNLLLFCHGDQNGSITLDVTGQRGPYTYSWSPTGAITRDISGLSAGAYTLTVTDTVGCETIRPYLIQSPDSLRAPITVKVTCNGINGGKMKVHPSGGVGPYTYLWSTGSTNDSIIGLASGTYQVTVTDANNCSRTDLATIVQPALLEIDVSAPDSLLCMGESALLGTVTTGGTGIYTYSWSAGLPPIDGNTVTPTVTTTYKVLVRDDHSCTDVDSVQIIVSPIPQVDFSFSNECIGIVNEFTNLSTIATGTMAYSWSFGDGSALQMTQDAMRMYTAIGTYPIKLIATSNMQCVDSVEHAVIIHAIPVVNFDADDIDGCAGHCVQFTDLSTVANSTITNWSWKSDGIVFSDLNAPLQCFPDAGLYTIGLTVTSAGGCQASGSIADYLNIFPFPVADFEMSSHEVTIYNTFIRFEDESTGAVSWDWDLGDGDSTTETVFGHYYQDSGYYCIELQVASIDGCVDTLIKCLLVRDQTTIYVPNSFTPDGSEFNETFMAKGTSMNAFHMTIYNRWGQVIFESNDINVGWDGTMGANAAKCPMGMYIYRISIVDANQMRRDLTGHLTLIRL